MHHNQSTYSNSVSEAVVSIVVVWRVETNMGTLCPTLGSPTSDPAPLSIWLFHGPSHPVTPGNERQRPVPPQPTTGHNHRAVPTSFFGFFLTVRNNLGPWAICSSGRCTG